MIIVDAAQLVIPQIIRRAIDILKSASFNEKTLIFQCSIIIAAGFIMAVLRYCWRNLLMGSARYLEKGIRNDLFRHILTLDMAYYDKVKTGDIMAHAISDINHVRMAFGFGIIAMVDTILLGSASLVIMILTSPRLTVLAMIPMPFLIIVTRILGKKMHKFHQTAQESYSNLTELVRESFFGIRIIKVFNFESLMGKKVENASGDYFKKNLKRAFITALLKPLLGLFFNTSTLIVIFYGGFLVIKNRMTPGELVAFLQYLGILAWPVIAIGWMTNLFERGMASLNRINNLLDAVPDVKNSNNPIIPLETRGNIVFKDVSFSYNFHEVDPDLSSDPVKKSKILTNNEKSARICKLSQIEGCEANDNKNILSHISLEMSIGQSIGITGPPGSGKTTLVQLIPRLYNASSGRIFMDGIDINLMDLDFLRQQIAFMPQESFLFSGTIRENILMGRDIDKKRLERIIHICSLQQTLEEMKDGLDTIVGERGITLSGGQKQRIALARTLILNKPVIILDDPISQMDTDTASKVISKINGMNLNACFIIISHRISALSSCDTIYILKNGKIKNSGTHEELIEKDPFYRESYIIQQFEDKFE